MGSFKKIAAIGILAIVVVVGVLAYTVLRAPAEATAPIEAIPLASSAASASSSSTAPVASTASASSSSTAPIASTAPTATAAAAAATAATAATDTANADISTATAAPTASTSPVVLEIVQDESEARFVIDEVLNNEPFTVVGTTNQVAGQIAVDPQDPPQTRVGVIQVNARTLATDSAFRDRAIKNRILNTDQYEFVTFTPTAITGLPENGAVGETYTFQITGDLTIRDVTRQATFDVTVTPESETRLRGSATTTINYADYGLTIPQVRQVASVSDQVRLELDFVAVAQ